MKKILFLSVLCFSLMTSSYGQVTGSFVVKGSINNYYPVTFYDGGYSQNVATEIELGRSDVHIDGSWRGSLISKFRYHTGNNGNGSNFIEANINQNRLGLAPAISDFIGGWKDATATNGDYKIIIWLRGGTTTYYYKANATVTPVVYDGVANPLPYQETGGPQDNLKTAPDVYVNKQGINVNSVYATGDINYFGGNVGIGISPLFKLHVNTGLDKNILFRAATDFGLNVPGAAIQSVNNANSLCIPMDIESSTLLLNAATGGNVGISTSNPQSKLQIGNFLTGNTNSIVIPGTYNFE